MTDTLPINLPGAGLIESLRVVQDPTPSILHLRPSDSEGRNLPTGGITVAYYQAILNPPQGEPYVAVIAGFSLCQDIENYQKKIGRAIASSRLWAKLKDLNTLGPNFVMYVTPSESLEASRTPVKELATTAEGIKIVSIKESDLSILGSIVGTALERAREFRFDTYEGDNQDVLDEIEALMADDEDESDEDNSDLDYEEAAESDEDDLDEDSGEDDDDGFLTGGEDGADFDPPEEDEGERQ